MATASEISAIIADILQVSGTILPVLESLDPGVAVPAEVAQELANLAAKALAAWSAASATPITVESVQALLPNQTPLTPPTS